MLKIMIAPVTRFQQNCSIAWCDETMEGTAVDPGGDFDRLKQAIAEQGIKVTKVLLTHGHVDHASAAGTMADHYGVKIEGPHRDDLFLIEGLPDSGRKYNFPVYKPFVPDRWLEGGESRLRGRCAVPRLDRPHGFSARQSRSVAELDPQAAMAAGRRHHLRARPRPDLDLRLGTQDQFVRRRSVVRRRRRRSEGLEQRPIRWNRTRFHLIGHKLL